MHFSTCESDDVNNYKPEISYNFLKNNLKMTKKNRN